MTRATTATLSRAAEAASVIKQLLCRADYLLTQCLIPSGRVEDAVYAAAMDMNVDTGIYFQALSSLAVELGRG